MSLSPFKLYCQRCHVVDRKDCNCNWYQKKRNENLARNEEVLRELGFGATHYEVHEKSTTTKRKSSGTDVPLERRISPRTNSFSESRGSRPTLSKAKLESLPFIICEDCDKKIYNKKNLTDEVLLRWHQVNSRKSCGPVRQIDTEMPLGCTFDDIDDESDNDIFHDENGFVETSGSESEWGTYNDSESNSGGDDENSETFSESDFENDDAETYFVDAEMDYDDAEIDQGAPIYFIR
jgi:hypothetical protein